MLTKYIVCNNIWRNQEANIMTNYYKTYIEPILNGIGDDAHRVLEQNSMVQYSINQIHNFKSMFQKHKNKETMINMFYWCVIQMYCNTRFMNTIEGFGNYLFMANDKKKYNDIYEKLDIHTGKLNIPKRNHDIFDIIESDTHGYMCRMRRKDKYPFYIITTPANRTAVYNAIQQASCIPMHNTKELLNLLKFIIANSQIKSTVSTKTKENGHGYISCAQEIWGTMHSQNRILNLQEQIHTIQDESKKHTAQLDANLSSAQQKQFESVQKLNAAYKTKDNTAILDASQSVASDTNRCNDIITDKKSWYKIYQQSIEQAKLNSGLPFAKLRAKQK